ncbi:MAG: hypothetical protein NZ825_00925 [Candidatus Marinimicrobia bacterium]|nr:hypothetical protein [Candidatus Neomarinimicrobiota bacterium]
MHQFIITSFARYKIDWNLVFLLSIPFILLAANQEWLFPYGYPSDAWIAKRYFLETGHDYPLTGETWGSMYENYKASRISWIIKGFLIHKLFSPVTAHYVLHLSMFCLMLGTFYLIVKKLFNKHVAFIAGVAFGTYSQFHAVVSYEWDYTTHDGALNILLTMLFMLFASQSRKWKLWLVLSGATWASALQSIYLGALIPAVAFWYLCLNQQHLRHPIIPSILYLFSGAVAATLFYCVISYLLGGPFLFFLATIEPIIMFSGGYGFHLGYWHPLATLLQSSKGIVLPILGGFIAIALLITNLVKGQKNQLASGITLTQYTLLICLLAGFFLHFVGHGMMTSDHMLAVMSPFVFLSLAGLYALLLNSVDIANPSNLTIINRLKAAILLIFCSTLIFYWNVLGQHLDFIRRQEIEFLNDLKNTFLMSKTTILLIAGIIICFVMVFLANTLMRRHALKTVIVLSLALSGFLSITNTQTASIAIESYDVSNKCGTRKDQYKSIIDVFFKLRPYNLNSEPVRKTLVTNIPLREPLLWYKNNALLKHPDADCQQQINLTDLYGGILGIRGYIMLRKEMLFDTYLRTPSFSILPAKTDRFQRLPEQFLIAVLYSNQNEIQTALASLESEGFKAKILDQSRIENGSVSFNLMTLDLKRDARTKAKHRN